MSLNKNSVVVKDTGSRAAATCLSAFESSAGARSQPAESNEFINKDCVHEHAFKRTFYRPPANDFPGRKKKCKTKVWVSLQRLSVLKHLSCVCANLSNQTT